MTTMTHEDFETEAEREQREATIAGQEVMTDAETVAAFDSVAEDIANYGNCCADRLCPCPKF